MERMVGYAKEKAYRVHLEESETVVVPQDMKFGGIKPITTQKYYEKQNFLVFQVNDLDTEYVDNDFGGSENVKSRPIADMNVDSPPNAIESDSGLVRREGNSQLTDDRTSYPNLRRS